MSQCLEEMQLPRLTTDPKHFPDCCLSLSEPFLITITKSLQTTPTRLVLSVGSGTGLLEALLQQHWMKHEVDMVVEGVEVVSKSTGPVNIYLPEEAITTVHGTWDLTTRVRHADAVMFVYPRDPALISKYLAKDNTETWRHLNMIIWMGPRTDWPDFEASFGAVSRDFHPPEAVTDARLVDYEVVMTMTRRGDVPTL